MTTATRGRRRPRVVVVIGLLLCALALSWLVRDARTAALELDAARVALTGAQESGDVEAAVAAVRQARTHVERAEELLSGPPLTVVRWVPVVGRSVLAARAVARAAGSSLDGAVALADSAPQLRVQGGVDVRVLRQLAADLGPLADRAARDAAALDAVVTDWTPARVQSAVADSGRRLEPVVRGLSQVASGAELAAGLLGADRPRNVLVALGNNAELRGTGGYVSTFATGVAQDGRLRLDPFRDVDAVRDDASEARPLPAPPEYLEDYGPFLANTTLWREWTMSPDVPDAASVGAAVAGELLGVTPDVVVLLDVPALTAIVGLAGGGEVVLGDGSVVPADRLTDALLVDAYAEAGGLEAEQDARRAALREAAGRTASGLLTGEVAVAPVVRELTRLARGRHLAVWSADTREQVALERIGLAGSADPRGDDLALISVNNLNANKLDYYVERTVSVDVVVGLGRADVRQRVVLTNRAPQDLVPYVAGYEQPGTVVERVEFSLAPDAELQSATKDGVPARGDVRRGVERTRVHTFIELARGESVEVEVRYAVPVRQGRYRLQLHPQPLARDAVLDLSVSAASGASLRDASGAQVPPVRRTGPWAQSEVVEVRVR